MRYFYIIFIFFCFKAKAQKLAPNFFSTTSSYYPYQTQSQSIVNYFDDYLVSHNVVRIDTIPFLNIELYDSNFNLVKNKFLKLLPSDGLLFYNNNPPLSINLPDSSVFVFTTMAHNWATNGLCNGLIFKLNKNLDTLWHKEYHNVGDSSLYLTGAIKQSDGFLVYGASRLYDVKADAFILKIDFDGNELWRRTYQNSTFYGGFKKFIATKNKGYAGFEECVDFPSAGYSDIKVSYYDSLYNLKWETVYSTPYRDLLGDLIETSDSNLIYTGGLGISQTFPPTGALFTKQYIKKINKNNGNPIWEKTYANLRNEVQLWGICESPSKKLYSGGWAVRPNAQQPSPYVASLLVTNQYGDSLNYQETFHDTISKFSSLLNLLPINNGFICVGRTDPAVYSGTVITTFDDRNWLIKADTNGCFMQMCADGFGTSVVKVENQVPFFKLYPNPTNQSVTVQFVTEDVSKGIQMIMYDITGKVVITQAVKDNLEIIIINNLTSGMYLVTMVADGKVIGKQKLIKE